MSRILVLVFALALVFGLVFAYSGFNAETGTGTIGVGQVDHPKDGNAPDYLVATRTATRFVQWTCTRASPYDQNLWTARAEQDYIATAPAKLNPKDMVLNYTFGGWEEGAFRVVENDHIFDWYLRCNYDAGYQFAWVTDTTTYGEVGFNY